MFNGKTNKKKKISVAMSGVTLIALAATLGYALDANAEIKASVAKPVLRSEYKSSDIINLDGDVSLRNGNQKISISLRDTDLRAALRMIADKAGLNIIFHNSVEGQIALDLVNVSLNDAFKMIMQANDLTYLVENGTLIIMSKDASQGSDISKQNMMTLPVKYADSAKVADFLNSNIFSTNRPGLSNNKIVVTNPVTNELIIFGTPNDYKMAQKVLSKLDVPPKTISYRVNHTTPKEMATLICQSLFPNASTGSSGSGSTGSSDLGSSGASALPTGSLTGGAASSGGDSSGGSSGGTSGGTSAAGGAATGSSGGSSSGDITLGEGKVACSVKADLESGNLKSLGGASLTVTYFPQKGTINITGGSESQAEMIKQFIQANDKKQPQAYMEVQIVELTEDGSKEFSNTWNIMTPFFSGSFSSEGLSNPTNTPMFFSGGPYYTYATDKDGNVTPTKVFDRYHGKNMIGWNINYLIQNKKARMLANPKVVVTNGKKSVIDLTSDYVKSVEEEIMSSSFGANAGVSRTYEIGDDMGISVELTPFISPDGYVTLNLKPSYSTEKGKEYSVSQAGGSEYVAATLLQRRNLELSNVRIKDGETLVLGGMVQEQENKDVTKFPFLGDLPIIGSAFRSTKTTNVKTELVIMVTPRIIKDTEDAVAESENL